jgi:hypothetical protein
MGPRYDAGDPVCGHARLICAAGLIPLTVPAIKHLLAALLTRPHPPGHHEEVLAVRGHGQGIRRVPGGIGWPAV